MNKTVESVTTPDSVLNATKPSASKQTNRFNAAVVAAMVGMLVIGGAGGFVAGLQLGNSGSTSASAGMSPGGNGQMGGPGSRMGGFGEVTAVDASSITVKDERSNQKTTYTITDDTKVTDNNESVEARTIEVGDTVMIRASGNGSSDKTASVIELNPTMGGPGSMPGRSNSSSTDASNTSSTDT